MIRIILSFIFTVISIFTAIAQDFQGMAVYETKTSSADFKSRFQGNKEITPEMQARIEERMKKMFEKTFILNFNKTASIYKEEEKMEAPTASGQQGGGGGGMRMMASFMGAGGTHYKNVKEKSYIIDKEFMGKEFLVKDSLPKLNWKLESETKVIGGYTCYKATAVRAVSQTDFKNLKPKEKAEEKTEDPNAAPKEKRTNFMDNFEMPKEVTVTAWYSPEIPINQGPENYWGLPGLILEVSDGKTVMLCSKVVLNSKEKTEIKPVNKGKVVSQKEYDETVLAKMKEWEEMRKGRNGGTSGGAQIRMGN